MEQKLKSQIEELERKIKDIGTRSLELINHHRTKYGKDTEWDMAININNKAHKVHDEFEELKRRL
jgi:hypothetical protein